MARERITFPVNLRQNTNDDSTAFGKWFPVPSTSEPMSLKGFAKHLAEHGKLASYDMLVLVLQNIVGCLKELILQGQSVKLDGLGTFRPTIEGKGSNDVETAVSLGANVIIEGIHLRFSPENAKGEKLTSRALKNECAFEFKDVLIRKEKTVDGKKKVYFEKIAVSDYALSQTEATPGGSQPPYPPCPKEDLEPLSKPLANRWQEDVTDSGGVRRPTSAFWYGSQAFAPSG